MSILAELDGTLAIVGGLSGLGLLTYFSFMIYYTRQKEKAMQRIEVQLARIEGLIIGGARMKERAVLEASLDEADRLRDEEETRRAHEAYIKARGGRESP